mgnify:CR=1 FL=1
MKKSTTFYIFEVGSLYLLIIFTLSTVIAFYQLLTGDEFVNNFFNFSYNLFIHVFTIFLTLD